MVLPRDLLAVSSVRGEVARHPGRDGTISADQPRLVLGAPRARRVGLLEPVRDDRLPPADRVAVVPRVEAIDRVLAEERADPDLVVRPPRGDVVIEPPGDRGLVHAYRVRP